MAGSPDYPKYQTLNPTTLYNNTYIAIMDIPPLVVLIPPRFTRLETTNFRPVRPSSDTIHAVFPDP